MRVLVTGSREWTARGTLRAALNQAYVESNGSLEVIHGGALGADAMAANWVIESGEFFNVSHRVYLPDYEVYRTRPQIAPLMRNQLMVDLGPALCLAFLTKGCRGTIDCAARAQRAGIPVRAYFEA